MNSLENSTYNNTNNNNNTNNIIENLHQSNYYLTKNVINLTNDLVHFSSNYDRLNSKITLINDEKNKLVSDKHTLIIENNIFKNKITLLESDIENKKYEIYSKDLNIKSLKESFELNCHSKNILIQKYIDSEKKSEKIIFELQNKIKNSQNKISEQEKKLSCSICYKNSINILLEPCNHMCICETCLSELSNYSLACPVCRQTFTSTKKIYF